MTRLPDDNPQRWGDFSAIDFHNGVAWFSVPLAVKNEIQYGSWISTERL